MIIKIFTIIHLDNLEHDNQLHQYSLLYLVLFEIKVNSYPQNLSIFLKEKIILIWKNKDSYIFPCGEK